MAHDHTKEADEILDHELRVLDHGFVRLVDYMGSDSRIVGAARVSYGAGTKTFREDRMLINYLLMNDHTSPFEQVVLTFHVKLPIFVARQWIRHRTARVNEISGRYSIMKEEFYVPDESVVAPQSTSNKQGRSPEPFEEGEAKEIAAMIREMNKSCYEAYNRLIEKNLAKEISRGVLPLNLYTEWYWQIDLHNLFHFLQLRLHPHAQYEIREYAKVLFGITKKVAPIATEAFEAYKMNAVVTLSAEEAKLLAEATKDDDTLPKLLKEKLVL
ncbi:MAG TPA: FAD-dependent thymidylate synthase [Acidobacteriota bacterium]|jgi:thymidylate synthase (FAD)|nr:FAD-dependent thymidylate synthase [Acidobacteriota bacterium]HNT17013.1 FAD-dependent thymidylate synthase [Acidobacteriota bacterium]HPA27189.1 FAD-dependent thymidylate synthase [Acidobacteriota bacterium]HQO20346.1 FAD-dependent thymidylate synthase [Acidobacteriota bacterium]HQQ47020.1 FAD-dependent thymidylate synthase [Acidobacteriota bacterium]